MCVRPNIIRQINPLDWECAFRYFTLCFSKCYFVFNTENLASLNMIYDAMQTSCLLFNKINSLKDVVAQSDYFCIGLAVLIMQNHSLQYERFLIRYTDFPDSEKNI